MLHNTTPTEPMLARGQVTLLGQRQVWRLERGLLMVQSLSRPGEVVRHLLLQQRRWTDDMLALRSGSVEQRLGRWLELLGRAGGGALAASSDEVPTLREIATLADAAPETVCRVLARLRAPATAPDRTKTRPARWVRALPLAAF